MATTDEMVDGGNEHKGLARALRRRSRVAWPGSGPTDAEFRIYVYEREL